MSARAGNYSRRSQRSCGVRAKMRDGGKPQAYLLPEPKFESASLPILEAQLAAISGGKR